METELDRQDSDRGKQTHEGRVRAWAWAARVIRGKEMSQQRVNVRMFTTVL